MRSVVKRRLVISATTIISFLIGWSLAEWPASLDFWLQKAFAWMVAASFLFVIPTGGIFVAFITWLETDADRRLDSE